jgi:hypothetical protein
METELIKHAHAALLRAFSDRLRAPYAEGKTQMAGQISASLGMRHESAVSLVEMLEKDGRIRFEGPLDLTSSPRTGQGDTALTSGPLTPETNTAGIRPEAVPGQPVLGEWIIATPAS